MQMLGGFADGTAREYATFDAEGLVINPPELGDLEAATLPCAGLTAWNALFQHRPIKPGEWVYCPGTGGVSLAAMQFAKAAGAHVVITSSSDAKLARAKAMGADVCINYRTVPDLALAIRDGVGGGIDVVVDVVGKDQLELNLSLLNEGGLVAAIGMLGAHFSWGNDQFDDKRMGRITTGNREEHEAMLAFCAETRHPSGGRCRLSARAVGRCLSPTGKRRIFRQGRDYVALNLRPRGVRSIAARHAPVFGLHRFRVLSFHRKFRRGMSSPLRCRSGPRD